MPKKQQLRRPLTPSERASQRPFVPSKKPKAQERDIELVAGKGTKNSGGRPGGHYWHIYYKGKRAGRVFINLIDPDTSNPYPAITVEINANKRGIGIGTIAFRRACEQSDYSEVFASIRKSNLASLIAAERAGFKEIDKPNEVGVFMVWRRQQ